MKTLMAMAAMLSLCAGMVACGTEDDPTLGIDEQEMTAESALTYGFCQVTLPSMTLSGKCTTSTAPAIVSPTNNPKCTPGVKVLQLRYGPTPIEFDLARPCSW